VGQCDVVVVGAGIAGASAAWALAARHRVVLLEMERQPGYHATGRSAATLSETVGEGAVRALAAASRPFLASPPAGFVDHPLLSRRGLLWIGNQDDAGALDHLAAAPYPPGVAVCRLTEAEVRGLVPQLRSPWTVSGGVHEPEAMEIDVDGLLQGYLRGVRARGGQVVTSAAFAGASPASEGWRVRAGDDVLRCRAIVDAAGAWGDEVARRAGVPPLGLAPLRRTAALVAAPDDVRRWPLVMDVRGRFYAEPEAGGLLVSPADEQPSAPCDARPEEIDVALVLERLTSVTTLTLRSVRRAWAGLRTFSPDRVPVAGEEPGAAGFFWLVGQGGAGIKTAPALAAAVAALVAGEDLPPDLRAQGLTAGVLSPRRFCDRAAARAQSP
jgi:D-arginine dehydrogenase